MKRILSIFSTLIVLVCSVVVMQGQSVYAVDIIGPACQGADSKKVTICEDNKAAQTGGVNPIFGPGSILATAVNILSLIGAIIAIFVLLIGGVKMITSSGDSNSIASARRTVLYAVISLVIIASAQLIVRVLLSKINI